MNSDISLTISQFEHSTDEYIHTYDGTLNELVKNIPEYQAYYYRVSCFGLTTRKKVSTMHFGCHLTATGGVKADEGVYINSFLNYIMQQRYKGETAFSFWHVVQRDNWFREQTTRWMEESYVEFSAFINSFLEKNTFLIPVKNLNHFKKISGIYFMILDGYHKCYIGQSNDIKKRILQHWSNNSNFNTKGIDLFRAKDTTRLYAAEYNSTEIDFKEHELVNMLPVHYRLNILPGGTLDYFMQNEHTHSSMHKKNDKDSRDIINDLIKTWQAENELVQQNKDRFLIKRKRL